MFVDRSSRGAALFARARSFVPFEAVGNCTRPMTSPAVDNGRVRATGAATCRRRHREHYLLSLFSEHAPSSPGSYSPPQSCEMHGGAATSPCQGSRPLADDENDTALQTPPTFLYGIYYYRSLHRCSWAILISCIPSKSPYKGHPTLAHPIDRPN
jgi:hypothetical protein